MTTEGGIGGQQLRLEIPTGWDERPGNFPGCTCRPGCATPAAAYHRLNKGCESCDCAAWPHPQDAVELAGHIHMDDEAIVFYRFESHWLGWDESNPFLELYGPVSPTGYTSAHGLMGADPGVDWKSHINAAAFQYHSEWVAEQRKPRKKARK